MTQRAGICYFYPEEVGTSEDVFPSICDLDHYQVHQEDFAVRWPQYLYHLQGGSTEPHHIFSCLSTIDSTHIDPLLLLTAALILQACQRCPLVLSLLHRVDSTQMPHNLAVKVMVHETETETYNQITMDQRPDGLSSSSSSGSTPLFSAETSTTVFLTATTVFLFLTATTVFLTATTVFLTATTVFLTATTVFLTATTVFLTATTVFLTATELQYLRSSPVYRASRSQSTPRELLFSPSPSFDTPGPLSPSPIKVAPETSHHTLSNGKLSHEVEEGVTGSSYDHSFNDIKGGSNESGLAGEGKSMQNNDRRHVNGQNGGSIALGGEKSAAHRFSGEESREPGSQRMGNVGDKAPAGCLPPASPLPCENSTDAPLLPTALYQHRVRGLVLALLVERQFHSDTAATEEVYLRSLASLKGLEAHLRTTAPGASGPQGHYTLTEYRTCNLSGRPGGAQDRSFVRATSLLHSHFSHTEALQEAIVRSSAGATVYGTHSVAQETYFLQQGGAVRNSGIPDHQDNAFSLPSKARHRLLKHRVNLL
uniref:HPS4 biogenesis of lysosomal organelles complex 3 subunit 2 n=1 Tax=Oncorhynchus tshawytscha TaxID=74940 RepID=A0A8C8GI96_ONCTS